MGNQNLEVGALVQELKDGSRRLKSGCNDNFLLTGLEECWDTRRQYFHRRPREYPQPSPEDVKRIRDLLLPENKDSLLSVIVECLPGEKLDS